MPNRNDLAKIHIAKKVLRMKETTYRGILRQRYHLDSAADLTPQQAADLIALFRAKGWRPSSPGQRGLIHALWHKLYVAGAIEHGDAAALNTYLFHVTTHDNLSQLTAYEASRVIEMLKKWLEREGVNGSRH
ncbi:MAG: regulatory protein GemA [Desulfuromonas sp.]|nr:MAG: regulatory protein GemA [Desulfuromonas sp.]